MPEAANLADLADLANLADLTGWPARACLEIEAWKPGKPVRTWPQRHTFPLMLDAGMHFGLVAWWGLGWHVRNRVAEWGGTGLGSARR